MDTIFLNDIEALRAIIEESPMPIGLFAGREMRIKVANKAIQQAWGKDESVIGKTFHDAIPELNDQPFDKLLDDVYSTGIAYHATEDRVDIIVNGRLQIFYFNFTYKPLKDKEGNVWGVLNTATDVTELVVARKQREEAEERLRMAIESAELGTWAIDATTHETFPSDRTKELFGLNCDEEMGLDTSLSLIDEKYRDYVATTIETAFEKGGSYDLEYPIHDAKTQRERWVRTTGKLYTDENGKPLNFSGIIMDITERKHNDMRKNDFIAMVSHELKTPLTSIKSYIQLLINKIPKGNDEFLNSALVKADRQIVKMTKMIHGFLDMSKLESGKITLSREEFNLCDLLNEIVADVRFYTYTHFFEIYRQDNAIVYADRNKIGQVIDNFLSNAIKYSPRETVIDINCIVIDSNVQISVADKGIGVKPKDQAKVFDKFYRVDNDIIKTVAGFGIGLYLAGEIIHLHNGKIWVESEECEGATFYFSIPLA
ncbi:ATP-binding protein [Mucilaginibacter gynuensis]|uniref:histidine kinase n=1 Tax=Mucilaginibacter gynuensis TaxID=1302236 RepID=A0ABP8G2C7_9SPHI